jgi:uncharacterized protein (TIGR02594 family)
MPAMTSAADPPWLRLARREVGQKELKGGSQAAAAERDNPQIVAYWRRAGILKKKDKTLWTPSNDEVPWCAAFIGAMLRDAGFPGSGEALARSYQRYGIAVMNADRVNPWFAIPAGALVVLNRNSAGPTKGHVGFAVGNSKGAVQLLGGNQNDAVSIDWFPKSRIVDVRWPAGAPFSPYLPLTEGKAAMSARTN